jgi:hypothetical protein
MPPITSQERRVRSISDGTNRIYSEVPPAAALPFRSLTTPYARYGGRLPTIFLDRNVVYHSTVECPDYPQPPEAWWAWPHYLKGI